MFIKPIKKNCVYCGLDMKQGLLESNFNFKRRKYCTTDCYNKATKHTRSPFRYGSKMRGVDYRD